MSTKHDPRPADFRTIPAAALDLVREFEGLQLTAYRCPAGVWTIGYGHTGGVKAGMRITKTQAEAMLLDDLMSAAADVLHLVKVPLTDGQLGALASLVFNIGATNFASSTVLKRLNAGDPAGAAGAIGMWVKATVNGKKVTLPGLVRRRAAETDLFTRDSDHTASLPQAVEAAGEMKPLTKSRTVQAGAGGLGTAAIVAAISEAREASDAVRGALDGLPPGGLGWLAAAVLAAAVAVMLYRRWDDKRKASA